MLQRGINNIIIAFTNQRKLVHYFPKVKNTKNSINQLRVTNDKLALVPSVTYLFSF